MNRLTLLDNEAVQALMSTEHPKHRAALAHVEAVGHRKKRGTAATVELVVPTTVRVEAGWDRTVPAAATINRLKIRDAPLDAAIANAAASIAIEHGVSPADAHLGAVARSAGAVARVTILTSDPQDLRRVAESLDVVIVTL